MPRSALRQLGPTLDARRRRARRASARPRGVADLRTRAPRLRSLEDAARKVGAGDLTARAREDGGDEVAALARAFNQMTHDLQQRAAQLQAADRTRRLLLADVSHELMTPLTGMRGYLETLSLHAGSLDPDTRERYLAIIRDETQRVEHIVGDLLDLVPPRRRRRIVRRAGCAAGGSIRARRSRATARPAEQKGVEMTTDIAPGAEIVAGDPDAARTGAAEPGGERAAPHAERRARGAERGISRTVGLS